MKLVKKMTRFVKDECGASMVEYGVALLVVTGVGITFMTNIGTITGQTVTDACKVVNGNTAC